VDQAVEDGVGQGGVAGDQVVPAVHCVLDDNGPTPLAFMLVISREAISGPIRRAPSRNREPISQSRRQEPGWDGGKNVPEGQDRPAAQPGGKLSAAA
jgi:hypothetical protein